MPEWLRDAAFYEIYPQSYNDTNGDGIGDIDGITEKLDYIKSVGFNALWINPCFDSPFKDAGYDVRDYKKVAPRYGTNSDLYRLFGEAHKRGMHVLLDLVPGHTSEEHEWFVKSKKQERNEYSDRYVWADNAFFMKGHPYIAGESERDGIYMLNFFKSQPALNYGFGSVTESWQMSWDSKAATDTREAMKDVMRFWMDRGCDGFRVDMADSLVKDDTEDKHYTGLIWKNVREMFDKDYPDCALVSEWNNPALSLNSGFHMDFTLDNPHTGYRSLLRDYRDVPAPAGTSNINSDKPDLSKDHSYFRKDGHGDITRFTEKYMYHYEKTVGKGYISIISGNHDTPRLRRTLTPVEMKLYYAFMYTMPGVPFMYYGDEIGMRYLNIPTKEGGYGRTGTRTPMQWDHEKNYGFSTAFPEDLYLPQDSSADAPTVLDEEKDPDSLLSSVKALLKLRHENTDLQADGSFAIVHAEKNDPLFVYKRGNFFCAVNPSGEDRDISSLDNINENNIIFSIGNAFTEAGKLTLCGQSFALIRTEGD